MMLAHIKEWGVAIAQSLVIVAIMYFIFWPVRIDGASMESTFQNGDRAFICKAVVMAHQISDEDVIVCKSKNYSDTKKLIKRVVAVSGDHLVIKDGKVFVNDKEIPQTYALGETIGNVDQVIPKDSVFVMGDNREHSLDSRALGLIDYKDIKGKVIFRLYPFNSIRTF